MYGGGGRNCTPKKNEGKGKGGGIAAAFFLQ